MSHIHFSEVDTQIAQFARAIALPIRVFILRMIALNGNSVTRQAFFNTAYNVKTINKHILELRALGIIKAKTVKAQVTYYIDQKLFDDMSGNFAQLFEQASILPVLAVANELVTKEMPAEPMVVTGSLGEFIKTQRLSLNLSQSALAKQLNIDRGLLSKIENGKRPFNQDRIDALAIALQTDAELLKDRI